MISLERFTLYGGARVTQSIDGSLFVFVYWQVLCRDTPDRDKTTTNGRREAPATGQKM